MMDEKIIRLIHKQIDGSLTPDEKKRLDRMMNEQLEVRKAVQEQSETVQILNEISAVETPSEMKKRIMNAIDENRYRVKERQKRRVSILPTRSAGFKWIPRAALTFSVGVVVGILLLIIFMQNPGLNALSNSRDFIGTIGMHDEAHFKRLERIPILLTGIQGAIALAQIDYSLAIEVNLNSTDEFELIIRYDSNQIEFQGFKPSTQSKVVLDNGESYIKALHANEVQYVLFLKRVAAGTAKIDLSLLYRGDVRLHRSYHLDEFSE